MNANLFSGRACLLKIDYRSLGQTLCTLQYVNMSLGGRGANIAAASTRQMDVHGARAVRRKSPRPTDVPGALAVLRRFDAKGALLPPCECRLRGCF